jgi:uncharacterized protein YndB with AHSA1/START domain
MTAEPDNTTVQREVVVDLSAQDAFRAFADLDRIKPREHNLLSVPIAETVLEQHAGGDLYDRGVDGSICRWGRVLKFEPPHVIAFTWDIGPDWQVTTDLERTSEVEVTFVPESNFQTRVTLVHRHIDRHGPGWESLRSGLDSPGGWPLYLERYDALVRGELETS